MRKLRAIPVVVLVVATAAGAAVAARRPARGGSARLPTEGPVRSLDPVLVTWPAEALLVSLLYDAPLQLGHDDRPRAHLLTLPQKAGEGRTLRLRVRRHAVFSDGTPVTAAHVVSSLGRLAASPRSGWMLAMVEGTAPSERRPSGIRAAGERLVEIELRSSRSLPELLSALATPQASIIRSPARVSRGVGTGPFALRKSAGGDRVLRANRDYFAGPPYLDEVTVLGPASRDDHIRRFQLGNADGSLLGDSVYGERPGGRVDQVEGPAAYLTCLVANGSRGPLRDVRLRRAVDLAISRDRLAGGGAEAAGLPGAKRPRSRDLRRARSEVEAHGGAPSGRPLTLLVDGDDPYGAALAPLLLRDLAEVGLDAERVVASGAAARARLTSGSWDMRLVTVAPASPDLVFQLGQLLALGGQTSDATRLVRDAGADRRGEVARALEALESQRLVLPLVRRSPRLHHRPHLRGIGYDRLGRLRVADIWARGPASRGGR